MLALDGIVSENLAANINERHHLSIKKRSSGLTTNPGGIRNEKQKSQGYADSNPLNCPFTSSTQGTESCSVASHQGINSYIACVDKPTLKVQSKYVESGAHQDYYFHTTPPDLSTSPRFNLLKPKKSSLLGEKEKDINFHQESVMNLNYNSTLNSHPEKLPVWERLYREASTREQKKQQRMDRDRLKEKLFSRQSTQAWRPEEWEKKWKRMMERYRTVKNERDRLHSHMEFQHYLEEKRECTFRPQRFVLSPANNEASEEFIRTLEDLEQQQEFPLDSEHVSYVVCKKELCQCQQEEFQLDAQLKTRFINALRNEGQLNVSIPESIQRINLESSIEHLVEEAQRVYTDLMERRLNLLHECTALHNANYQWLHLHGLSHDTSIKSNFDIQLVEELQKSSWFQLGIKNYPSMKATCAMTAALHIYVENKKHEGQNKLFHHYESQNCQNESLQTLNDTASLEGKLTNQKINKSQNTKIFCNRTVRYAETSHLQVQRASLAMDQCGNTLKAAGHRQNISQIHEPYNKDTTVPSLTNQENHISTNHSFLNPNHLCDPYESQPSYSNNSSSGQHIASLNSQNQKQSFLSKQEQQQPVQSSTAQRSCVYQTVQDFNQENHTGKTLNFFSNIPSQHSSDRLVNPKKSVLQPGLFDKFLGRFFSKK